MTLCKNCRHGFAVVSWLCHACACWKGLIVKHPDCNGYGY